MSAKYVSGKSTKVYKCNKKIKMNLRNKEVYLNHEEKNLIQLYWEQVLRKNAALFNGRVLSINRIRSHPESVDIDLYMTDYAHLTYVMNHEEESITRCNSVASGGLLITRDDYIILGQMGKNISFPEIIQCIGGGVSKEDIFGEEAPFNTFMRECYEEIGIKIGERSIVEPEKYIYIRNKMSTLGFCYVVHLDVNKDEVIYLFKRIKEKEEEISELIFVKKELRQIEEFCKQDKLVDYLKPVLQDYMNINEVMEFGVQYIM